MRSWNCLQKVVKENLTSFSFSCLCLLLFLLLPRERPKVHEQLNKPFPLLLPYHQNIQLLASFYCFRRLVRMSWGLWQIKTYVQLLFESGPHGPRSDWAYRRKRCLNHVQIRSIDAPPVIGLNTIPTWMKGWDLTMWNMKSQRKLHE